MMIDFELKLVWRKADVLMQDNMLQDALRSHGYTKDLHAAFATIVESGYVSEPHQLEKILIPLKAFYSACITAATRENSEKANAVRAKVTPLFMHVTNKELEQALTPPEVVQNNELINRYSEDVKAITFALADPRMKQIDPTFSEPSMRY